MEYLSVEQIALQYGLTLHQVRRRLHQHKSSALDIKVVAKNRKLYSKALVLLLFGDAPSGPPPAQNKTRNETQNTKRNRPPQKPIIKHTTHHREPQNETQNETLIQTLRSEIDYLRTQNNNLMTLLAMEKQNALNSPKNDEKNDLKTNEPKETAQSIGLLFLFVCSAILMLFFAFYLIS